MRNLATLTTCAVLAVSLIALPPTEVHADFACEPGHYSMYSPGSLGVPADVRVACTGTGFVMDVQWPFEPAAEWHNVYALNAVSQTLAVTVGGRPVANLKFIENPEAPPKWLIEGCPAEYGGTGGAVPWNDPCIRKVYHLVQRDFYFIKEIFARDGSPQAEAMSEALAGMAAEAGSGEPPAPGSAGDVEPTKPPQTPSWLEDFRNSHPPTTVEGNLYYQFPGAPWAQEQEKTASPPPPAPGTTIVPAALPPAAGKKP